MELNLNHSVTYTTKGDVPVGVVAKNLLANERFIHESLHLLSGLYGDFRIEKVNVKVSSLSNASPLRELLAVTIFFTYQDDLAKEVPELIHKLTGKPIPDGVETLVTVLVFLVAVYVIDAAVERVLPGKSLKALEKELNDKIEQVAALTGLSPELIEQAASKRFTEGKVRSLFRKASDFFLPAKIESDVDIRSDDAEFGISKEAIKEIPSELDFSMEETRNVYDLPNVIIEIHRADIDYSNQGWIAVVEEVSSRRRRIVLPPDIEPTTLYGKTRIIGDITVVEEKQMDGDYAVKEYHLNRIEDG